MHVIRPEILAQPNIIKPLHGLNPRTILGDARWNRVRQIVYANNDYHCMGCGVHKEKAKFHKWLEAHEVYEVDFENHSYTLKEIVPLCHCCHNRIHDGRLAMIHHKGEISTRKYNAIIKHGIAILQKSKISRAEVMHQMCGGDYEKRQPEVNGTRSDRGLVIDGKKYYSLFKDYGAWNHYYNH